MLGSRPWRAARVRAVNFPKPATVTVSPSASASVMVEVRAPSAAATSAFDSDERAATPAHSSDRVMDALQPVFEVDVQRSAGSCRAASPFAPDKSGENRTGKPLKTRFAVRNAPAESRLAGAQPLVLSCRGTGWFEVSRRDASKSPRDPGAQAGRSTGRRRKRFGSRWCISHAHWPAALSSEQSCGSPHKDSRARGSRCPPLVCACVRSCGELQGFPPTPVCSKCDASGTGVLQQLVTYVGEEFDASRKEPSHKLASER